MYFCSIARCSGSTIKRDGDDNRGAVAEDQTKTEVKLIRKNRKQRMLVDIADDTTANRGHMCSRYHFQLVYGEEFHGKRETESQLHTTFT